MSMWPTGGSRPAELSRPQLVTLLRRFREGELGLAELRHSWTPYLAAYDPLRIGDDEQILYTIVFHLEDDSVSEADHRRSAAAFERLLAIPIDARELLELAPLVSASSRLAVIVQRHLEGRVTRTSLVSVISKTRLSPRLKHRILGASPEELLALSLELEVPDALALARRFSPSGKRPRGSR